MLNQSYHRLDLIMNRYTYCPQSRASVPGQTLFPKRWLFALTCLMCQKQYSSSDGTLTAGMATKVYLKLTWHCTASYPAANTPSGTSSKLKQTPIIICKWCLAQVWHTYFHTLPQNYGNILITVLANLTCMSTLNSHEIDAHSTSWWGLQIFRLCSKWDQLFMHVPLVFIREDLLSI